MFILKVSDIITKNIRSGLLEGVENYMGVNEGRILNDVHMLTLILKQEHKKEAVSEEEQVKIKDYLKLLFNRTEENKTRQIEKFQKNQMKKNLQYQRQAEKRYRKQI